MAEICEICMKRIEFWENHGGNIDYETVEFILCNNCSEEVSSHNEKYPRRSLKRCVEEIRVRKRKWKNVKNK